jgi:hypothetical protein
LQQASLLVARRAFIYTVAAYRRPPVSSPSFVALETGLARFIRLSACSRRAAGRPLLHALLTIVEHSVAPFPFGWAYARGPDPILIRVVMPRHRPGSIGEERLQTERRLPNRVEDPSPCSLPDLRWTGCSTVHHEAAASLIALCPATHLPVTYWPADSAPLIAPLSLPSECCRLALRSQLCNIPPVRRLALRHQRPSQDYTSLIAIGLFL